MTFDFIHDTKFKHLLERDYTELEQCLNIKAVKAVLILSGSIIEAILTDYLLENLPSGKSKTDILKSSLGDLLQLAESEGLIGSKDKKLGEIIKDYRNLIHPGKQIRNNEDCDKETADLSKILLDIITKKIRNKHLESFNYRAVEVFDKLVEDWEFQTIFSLVITKLNYTERKRLLKSLIAAEEEYKADYEHYRILSDRPKYVASSLYGNLSCPKQFVQILKPLLNIGVIEEMLEDLKSTIIKGESRRALALYNLFHEEVQLLNQDDQQLIAIYILNLIESVYEDSFDLASQKTYSTIGKYLTTPNAKEELFKFSKSRMVNAGGEQIDSEAEVFEQIFNSLDTVVQKELEDEILKFLPDQRKKLEILGMEKLYDELTRTGIFYDKYQSTSLRK